MNKKAAVLVVVALVFGLAFAAQAFSFGFTPMAPQNPSHWPVSAGGQVTYQSFFGQTSFNFMGQGLVPGQAYELVVKSTTGVVVCVGAGQAATGEGQANSTQKAGVLYIHGMVPTTSLPKGKLQLILVPACQVNCAGHYFVHFNADECFFGASLVTLR